MSLTSEEQVAPQSVVCPECVLLWDGYRALVTRSRCLQATLAREPQPEDNQQIHAVRDELAAVGQRSMAIRQRLVEHQRNAHKRYAVMQT